MKTDQQQSHPVNFSRAFAGRCFLFNVFIVTYELRVPQPLTCDYHQWANGSVWRCPHVRLLHFPPWIFLYLPRWTFILPPSNISNVSLSIGPCPSHASSFHFSSFSQLPSPRNPEAEAPTHRSVSIIALLSLDLSSEYDAFPFFPPTRFLYFASFHRTVPREFGASVQST